MIDVTVYVADMSRQVLRVGKRFDAVEIYMGVLIILWTGYVCY